MTIHVRSNWDGASTPTDAHVDAVVAALVANHELLQTRFTPPAWWPMNPSDSVLFVVAQVLDVLECEVPTGDVLTDILANVGVAISDERRDVILPFIRRIFEALEEDEETDARV